MAENPAYPDQVLIIDHTAAMRYIAAALEPTSEAELWRPVTAWDATRRQIAYYLEEGQ